ncbi:unknown [Odoribacter laneus CAG:561]|nr:unknown [Odoribacter laneus CAG:561]
MMLKKYINNQWPAGRTSDRGYALIKVCSERNMSNCSVKNMILFGKVENFANTHTHTHTHIATAANARQYTYLSTSLQEREAPNLQTRFVFPIPFHDAGYFARVRILLWGTLLCVPWCRFFRQSMPGYCRSVQKTIYRANENNNLQNKILVCKNK